MAGFADQIEAWSDKAMHRLTLAHRKIALEAFTRVIMRSPVDTGRFRGNWQISIDELKMEDLPLDHIDPTGANVIAEVREVLETLFAGTVVYLANNLPYAQRLENGWSDQAPAGMVAITVVEFQPIVKQVAKQIASGLE